MDLWIDLSREREREGVRERERGSERERERGEKGRERGRGILEFRKIW